MGGAGGVAGWEEEWLDGRGSGWMGGGVAGWEGEWLDGRESGWMGGGVAVIQLTAESFAFFKY